jgi:hypothetical protein
MSCRQVDADWWYIWEFARVFRMHGRLKIILKVRIAGRAPSSHALEPHARV